MTIFLIVIGVMLVITLVAYIAAKLNGSATVLKSKIHKFPATVIADQCYSLPGYGMEIRATAQVRVLKSKTTKIIKGTELVQLTLEPTISIQPDTRTMVTLHYEEDWFSNDEIDVATSSSGLLENISVTSEDRIGAIVTQFTNVAKSSGDGKESFEGTKVAARQEELVSEILEFQRVFEIGADMTSSSVIPCDWIINLKGSFSDATSKVDASFKLNCAGNKEKHNDRSGESYDGILTRPLVQREWKATTNEQGLTSSFSCLVPDQYSMVIVPVKRSYFIKRLQMPKLANGLLIQNHIVKPSQVEALISIPINIAKAILSIPAQLFQFKMTHVRQQTELLKAETGLQKAQVALNESRKPGAERTEVHKITGGDEEGGDEQSGGDDLVEGGELPPLGKRDAKVPPGLKDRVFKMRLPGKDANLLEVNGEPDFPEERFWDEGFNPKAWQDYGNRIDGIQDCVPAAAAHMITCWTFQSRQQPTILQERDVVDAYRKESGFDPETNDNDIGCIVISFLFNWEDSERAPGKRAIQDFSPLKTGDRHELKFGIFFFGPCIIGLKMPETAQKQEAWKVVDSFDGLSADRGSWGGHSVAVVGYNKETIRVISWGKPIDVDWAFYEKYSDEAFAVLSPDWLKTDNVSPTPSSKDLATLKNTLTQLKNP